MEIMQKVARRNGLVCLLHEKPFKGVNGSGKHNNWSMSTDKGVNLLEPGETPSENAQFLLFLMAVIKAVDEYQDLLRVSVASAGNDFRLGANEAPPAIISIFLGSELQDVLDSIENDTPLKEGGKSLLRIGADVLPPLPKDSTDRNRTSPFAFTGNKFEFRALGSSDSISCANIMLNTAVAEELDGFAEVLEKAKDFNLELHELIKKTIKEHKRIIFNGNGYDESWKDEAKARGLLNLKTTPEALPYYLDKKNVRLFTTHGIYNENEINARYIIAQEHYAKVVNIEALTCLDMVNKDYLPALSKYSKVLVDTLVAKKELGLNVDYQYSVSKIISDGIYKIFDIKTKLEESLKEAQKEEGLEEKSMAYMEKVLPKMADLREAVDSLESYVDASYWPVPSYGDLLFGVK